MSKETAKTKHFLSVYDNEQSCLKAILEVHNDGNPIELDPMYFKGGFYKDGVVRPKRIYDINPRAPECKDGSAECLYQILDNEIGCMVLDPLFMFGNRKSQKEVYAARSMGIIPSFSELKRHYKAILTEAYRVLKKNGILIFKCQDYTDSKTTLTHCLVYNWAVDIGFYAKDIAILNRPHKVYNGNLKQRHLRKTHSYFFVFVKK